MDPARTTLAVALGLYVLGMLGLGLLARRRIRGVDDYLVAGRRLSAPLAAATLLATWFGAGTLLTATDEIREGGLRRAALDPLGAGLCLVVCGLFFARPLYRRGLLTLPDFYGQRFGVAAERVSALVMVPGYFGWIAAQIVALASLLEALFDVPLGAGIALVGFVGTAYTLAGGMWSVTITDAFQMGLVVLGLLVLGAATLAALGDGDAARGAARLVASTPPERLALVPTDDARALLGWSNVLAIGVLGNLPGQDLMQRVFAARSERAAARACHVAGGSYLLLGVVPAGLGLAAPLLSGLPEGATVPVLAQALLSPFWMVPFVLALASAVLSTIDSAILSPAGVLAKNLVAPWLGVRGERALLRTHEAAVLAVAAASLGVAYLGEDAYTLLEGAYAVGLVALLAPLVFGLFTRLGDGRAAVASMVVGLGAWLAHLALGAESFAAAWLGPTVPVELGAAAASAVAYAAVGKLAGPPRSRSVSDR